MGTVGEVRPGFTGELQLELTAHSGLRQAHSTTSTKQWICSNSVYIMKGV